MTFSLDLISGLIGFLFTLFIFSYLLGDNPLYRIAVYIFVGVSAGYIAAIVFWQVLIPKLAMPFASKDPQAITLAIIPLVFSTMILLKISPRLTSLASPAMAFLAGVASAVAVGGAVNGTLVPQILATANGYDMQAAAAQNVGGIEMLLNSGIVLLGAVTTLAYFHFGARKARDGSVRRFVVIDILAWIGGIFIAITLGALFAGMYSAALTAFIERINSMIDFIFQILKAFGLA